MNRWARSALTLVLLGALTVVAPACSAPVQVKEWLREGDFRERIQTQEANGVRVSAAVPSSKETLDIFGNDLYKKGIQPVWISIENNRNEAITFLPVGLDPHYYSPLEVANLDIRESEKSTVLVNTFFMDQSINLMVEPGGSLSGFVFTGLDEGTKAFNVDIRGPGSFDTFVFFIPVPGLRVDHYDVDWKALWPPEGKTELSAEDLVETLESAACCVTDKTGKNTGDPLNLVLIGEPLDLYTAFIRAGWDETETVSSASAWKTAKSFFSGGEYRYSPVSSLYAFGRRQDVAFQWIRENIHERNHLRLWMSNYTYEGLPVWIGQISRDIGVRFTRKTITTHKIDPNVDETREYLLENLAYAQALNGFAYVGGVGAVSADKPRGNLTGDPWFTDGYRLVLWLSSDPVPLSDIRFIPWRMPHGGGGSVLAPGDTTP
ncbi:MAG: LssY C-terminal domain-containing protein [Lysobacterales bacterium]|jgi:hypothetical protein